MNFWFEGILELEDGDIKCYRCHVLQKAFNHVYVEFELRGGGIPHPDELHPEPTGRYMCSVCGKMTLM